ncbi:1-phosphofructokinase family hexose kinase [Aliidiomarina maris]|uniref:Phosphofructokinase n=1 Tax=Aliidiomarina maris TaxID=531312 RepID=A0A327WYE2_9GAMM|nr:1-phosphofructokinase family hexose kinase [Aliidiomarina maris]MBA3988608.1 phosphofructokinase [Idiomarina sp.]RAJ98422.1 6-phosphofructokinase 2 [Aliidiomarina maris]RUO24763.1 phosphofructokinase [Aliidiomarina maris]
MPNQRCYQVVTFTMNPALDLFGRTEHIFDDSKSRCIQTALLPGGGGLNVARNVRRMGSDSFAIFPSGGPNGRYLEQLLKDEQQPYQAIAIDQHTRQNLGITDVGRGVMHHFVFPGPRLSRSELAACVAAICQQHAPWLVLSGSLGEGVEADFYAKIIARVRQQGTRVLLDTSGVALQGSLYQGAYLAKLNRKEFASLGYPEDASVAELAEQMQDLVAKGAVEVLIVTLNRGGAVLVQRDSQPVYVSAPAVHIVSHVGAGDSFMSALAHQLNQGAPLVQAFRYGVAAALVTVQCEGNQLEDLDWLERAYTEVVETPF